MQRLRILLLTAIDPSKPFQGDQWRAFGLWKGLKEYGDVTVVQWGGQQPESHKYIPMSTLSKLLAVTKSGIPISTAPYRSGHPPVTGHWDLVAGFQLKAATWALTVPAALHLLDLTDSLGYLREMLKSSQGTVLTRLKLFGVTSEEVELGRQFDECWVAAEPDAIWLQSRGLFATVVPNGVRTRCQLPPGDPKQLLFVGNLRYLPNQLGLKHFLRVVWPRLKALQFSLHLVGKGTGYISEPRVIGHGFVEDLQPFYKGCGIVISPVSVGAGTPNKVLEGLAHSRPVVGWTKGLKGLSETQRAGVVGVETATDWVRTLRAMQDVRRLEHMGQLGLATVEPWGDPQAEQIGKLLKTHGLR